MHKYAYRNKGGRMLEQRTTIFLHEYLLRRIKMQSAETGLTMKEIVTIALTDYFKKQDRKSK